LKEIINNLKIFIKQDYSPVPYIITLVFLGFSIFMNYTIGLEDLYIDKHQGTVMGLPVYFLFFAVPYFAAAIPKILLSHEQHILRNPLFWIKSLSFIAIIGVACNFGSYKTWVPDSIAMADRAFILRNINQLKWIIIYVPLLLIIRTTFDRNIGEGFYGINRQSFKYKPYLILLLMVLPLAAGASFLPDFLKAYPRFKPWAIQEAFNLDKWLMHSIFQIAYGSAYISTEIMFRGALVIGMSFIMGKHAVLPMVAVYTFYHFGKPAAEAISSIAGGYILGIIAYKYRNIWGGIVLHLGLAYMMEAAALAQHYLNTGKTN